LLLAAIERVHESKQRAPNPTVMQSLSCVHVRCASTNVVSDATASARIDSHVLLSDFWSGARVFEPHAANNAQNIVIRTKLDVMVGSYAAPRQTVHCEV
jgi:hypothetical protein